MSLEGIRSAWIDGPSYGTNRRPESIEHAVAALGERYYNFASTAFIKLYHKRLETAFTFYVLDLETSKSFMLPEAPTVGRFRVFFKPEDIKKQKFMYEFELKENEEQYCFLPLIYGPASVVNEDKRIMIVGVPTPIVEYAVEEKGWSIDSVLGKLNKKIMMHRPFMPSIDLITITRSFVIAILTGECLHDPSKCMMCETKGKMKQCPCCLKVRYCSAACQKKHWVEGHKKECKLLRSFGAVISPTADIEWVQRLIGLHVEWKM